MSSTVTHSQTTASVEQFWKAVSIWNKNPHVVNRRLCGALQIFTGKLLNKCKDIRNLASQIRAACVDVNGHMSDDKILQALQSAGIETEITCGLSNNETYILIKKLMPRNSDKFQECLELVILGKYNYQIHITCP